LYDVRVNVVLSVSVFNPRSCSSSNVSQPKNKFAKEGKNPGRIIFAEDEDVDVRVGNIGNVGNVGVGGGGGLV